jgi:S1-C subfamily serine protease
LGNLAPFCEVIVSTKIELEGVSLIQTTAPVNPVNNGGPMLETNENIAGMVSLKSLTEAIVVDTNSLGKL